MPFHIDPEFINSNWNETDDNDPSFIRNKPPFVKGEQGDQGIQGQKGDVGPQGQKGIQGIEGDQGDKGEKGAPSLIAGPGGDKGQKGEIGVDGSKGDKGEIGVNGSKGDKGEIGVNGSKGDKGELGITGEKGDTGQKGIQGEQGQKGIKGEIGEKGDTGLTGDKGQKGEIGIIGTDGNDGQKGDKGEIGEDGIQGIKGQKGEVGLQGITGIKGQKGELGQDGTDGNDGSKGEKGAPSLIAGQKGEEGIQGTNGQKGEQGVNTQEIDDTQISTTTCYSSTQLELTYLKKIDVKNAYDSTNSAVNTYSINHINLLTPRSATEDLFYTTSSTIGVNQLSTKLSLNPVRFGDQTVGANQNAFSTLIGYSAGGGSSDSSIITALGYKAGEGSTVGNGTTAIGYRAGDGSNGTLNTFLGHLAGNNTVGGQNFGLGEGSMDGGNVSSCVGISRYALRGATAQRTIALGINTMGTGFGFHTYATNSVQRSGNDKFIVGHNTNTNFWTTANQYSGNPYLIDGTLGGYDSVRIMKLNADELHLGSSLPTSVPTPSTQVWKKNGMLIQGTLGQIITSTHSNGLINIDGTPHTILPNYSGTANQFLHANSGTLSWQQLNKITSGQVVVNGATTNIELYNQNHTAQIPDKVNINVSSLAMPNYQGTTNQFLKANQGTLTWEFPNTITSGQIVGTKIELYLDDYDANTNPNDKVDIDISSLQIPSYTQTTNQFLKANGGSLSWEFPNTITSGDIVGSNLVLYLDDYDATTNPNDKITIDISDLQTGVSSFQSSPTTSATYLCSYINSRLPDTSSALGFLFLNTNGTSEYKMPSSVETQTALNTYSTFYINEFLSTASVGYKNLKFKSNNTTTGQTLGITDSWMSDGSNGYDRLTAISHNIANSSTKSGKIEFYTYNNLQTHGMAHLAMYLQDAKAYFQEITVANAITLMSGSITSNIINKCPANPQVHLESTNTSAGTIVIGNYKVKAPITSTASVAYPPQLSSASQTVSGITYTITSSSNLVVGSIYDRFRAFDKNTLNTGWHTTAVFASSGGAYTGSQSLNSTSGEWLKIHMTTAQPFGSVKIVGRNGYPSQDIKTWEILASNNNVNWTVLHQANSQQSYNGGNGTTTTFSNTTAYNYYALLVKSIQGPHNQIYGVVHELEFLTVATQVSTDVVDLKATKYSDDYTILDLQTRQAGLMTNAIRVGKTTANDINRITLTGNTTVIGQFTNNNLKISGTGSSITFNSGLQQTEAVIPPTTAQEGYRLTANGSSGWAWSAPDVYYDGTDRNINIGPENPSLGVDSISIGYYSGQISTTRSREQSVFIGTRAGQNTISTSTDTGKQFDNVVMIGHQAGQNSQYMENCCAIGSNAGASVDANPHSNSNFIGYYAGHDSGNSSTGGSAYSNGFFGTFAGRNYVGIESQGFGRDALYTYQKSTTMRYRNNAIGSTSMRNCIGDDNCAQGSATLRWDGSGSLTAHRNIAIGSDAMGILSNSACQNSNDNVFIGRQSGRNLSGNATGNVSIGKNSGYEMVGSKNVMLGTQAGYQHNGSNCIYIGENQGYQQTESNKIKIGTYQNQQIISGVMGSTSATSELELNAKRIDLPTSDLPTAYDSTKPNQLYVKNGQLRIGVDKDYYLKVSGQSTQTFGRSWTTYLFPTVDTDQLDVDGGSVYDSSVGHAVIQHDGLYFVSGTMRIKDTSTPENTNFAVAIHTSNNDGSHSIWDAVLDTTNSYDRTTVGYSKIVRFTQDQGVRTILYIDHGTAQQIQMAEMIVYRLGD